MIHDLQLAKSPALYELALAVGHSTNLKQNCDTFLKALIKSKHLSYAAVLGKTCLVNPDVPCRYVIYHALPGARSLPKIISDDHAILKELKSKPFFSWSYKCDGFQELIQEKDVEGGTYAVFRLGDFGFLKMFSESRKSPFSEDEMTELQAVIGKFAISLKMNIAQEQLKNEIASRKRTELQLTETKDAYRELFENMYDAIVVHDKDNYITDFNKAARKMLGLPKTVNSGEISVLDFVHPDEVDRVIQYDEERSQKGFCSDFELKIRTLDGDLKYIHVNSTAIFKDGAYVGAKNLIRDITKQRMAEKQIVNSELLFRKIINTSLDSIILINEEGQILEWNDFALKTFGFTKKEVLGKFVWNRIVPSRFRKAYFAEMDRFLKTGESAIVNKRFEISALRKNGEEFPIELVVSPIRIEQDYFFSLFLRDITSRKRSQNDLLRAKHAAEQARLAEQQFLANMSHEIRTPMNAVIGMTHLLYESEPSDTQLEYLDALKFSADSLLGIINNILDLSKIGAGEMEFEKRPFNLAELMRGLQQSFQFKVKDKPISVVMDLDYRIENMLMGDSTKLNQILTNLLGNASKFTHHGTIGIGAKLLEKVGNLYNIEFQVHDTGIGIPESKLSQIFDSFKQADLAVTRNYGGTGLGLSIVKKLIEMQGGSIEVESDVGQGSVFRFNLPLEDSGEKAESQSRKMEITQRDVDKALEAVSILVVEDNFMNQKLITKILDIWKCTYEIAKNGEEGVRFSKNKKYDLILMDVHMPKMDGCEATSSIRGDEENPNQEVPIIALTAAALLDEKKRVFESGMNDFLTKPFSPNVLKELLRKWLNLDERIQSNSTPGKQQGVRSCKTDFSYLSEFSGGDENFIMEMIETFLKESPGVLEEIKEAFRLRELEKLYNLTHRLRPTLMMMGMNTQENMAETIEKMAKSGDFKEDRMDQLIKQLYVDVCEVIPELKSKLKQMQKNTCY